MKTKEQETREKEVIPYVPPDFQVEDLVIVQNLLESGSSGVGDFGGSEW